MQSLQFYVPISKIDKERRMVWGYASTPSLDLQGERVALDAIKAALPDYMAWGNIREMHQPSAVGVAKEANVDDKGLFVGSKIVDDDAWNKCLEGVYKGYSIGGERLEKKDDTITALKLLEISLVDRPANPDCRIEVTKAAAPMTAEDRAAASLSLETIAASAVQGTPVEGEPVFTKQEVGFLGRIISKLSAPFTKGGDGLSAPSTVTQPDPLDPANQHATADTKVTPPGASDASKPELVELMDEKKDADSFTDKERGTLAEHGLAMRGGDEHGSYPIRNKADLERAIQAFGRAKDKAKVRAWIIHRAHELKATDSLPADWPGSTKAKEKASLVESLQKGLGDLYIPTSNLTRLAAIYDQLISLAQSLRWEADQEVGDKKDYEQARRVSLLAQAVGTLLAEHANEEVDEEKEREAARKALNSAGITLESINMTKSIFDAASGGTGGDSEIAKRAGTAAKSVNGHLAKARAAFMRGAGAFDKACSAAAEIGKCVGKSADSLNEHVAALHKALGETHKALAEHSAHFSAAEKVAGEWVGESGEAPGAGEAEYRPQEGLTALAQRHMTEGEVPDYDPTRPYPKTAGARVNVEAAVAEAVSKSVGPLLEQVKTLTGELTEARVAKAHAEGRAEVLSAMPAGSPRTALFSVDKGAFAGAMPAEKSDQDIAMEGVDVAAASRDPAELVKAAARMHGNKIASTITGRRNFGKSIMDPKFSGAAV
jgi:Caudovirus prohead serine protease